MTEYRHEFRLSDAELKYLKQLALRDETVSSLVSFPECNPGPKAAIQLSHTEAQQLSDILTNQLATVGFDENNAPNQEGQMIEDLIDKFFVP